MDLNPFLENIWNARAPDAGFTPGLHYDQDGDCLEFLVSNEAFVAERLDKWVTVYRGRESGQVIGSLIKNVRELLQRNPGLRIEVESGPVRLSHFLQAPKFSATSEPVVRMYQQIIQKAEDARLSAELASC
jgi:hypothetical protein